MVETLLVLAYKLVLRKGLPKVAALVVAYIVGNSIAAFPTKVMQWMQWTSRGERRCAY